MANARARRSYGLGLGAQSDEDEGEGVQSVKNNKRPTNSAATSAASSKRKRASLEMEEPSVIADSQPVAKKKQRAAPKPRQPPPTRSDTTPEKEDDALSESSFVFVPASLAPVDPPAQSHSHKQPPKTKAKPPPKAAPNGSATTRKRTQNSKASAPPKAHKKGRVAELSREDEPEAGPSTPQKTALPPQLTTPSGATQLHPLLHPETVHHTNVSIPIPLSETPAQRRNAAFRAAPASARRTSGGSARKERGRRVSSIGTGFEAQPHPILDTEHFYRLIGDEQPPPLRMRTLLSWTTFRCRDELGTDWIAHNDVPDDIKDARQAALQAAELTFNNIAHSRLDTDWPDVDENEMDTSELPSHPADEENAQKEERLQLRIKDGDAELTARHHRDNMIHYHLSELDSASNLYPVESTSRLIPPIPIPKLETEPHVQAFAKALEAAQKNLSLANPPPSVTRQKGRRSSTKGKERATEDSNTCLQPDEIDLLAETGVDLSRIRVKATHLHSLMHRACAVSTIYDRQISSQMAEAHTALLRLSLSHSNTSSESKDGMSNKALGLEALVGLGASRELMANKEKRHRVDPRKLLRGIAAEKDRR